MNTNKTLSDIIVDVVANYASYSRGSDMVHAVLIRFLKEAPRNRPRTRKGLESLVKRVGRAINQTLMTLLKAVSDEMIARNNARGRQRNRRSSNKRAAKK